MLQPMCKKIPRTRRTHHLFAACRDNHLFFFFFFFENLYLTWRTAWQYNHGASYYMASKLEQEQQENYEGGV
jgi:hypothetical protein